MPPPPPVPQPPALPEALAPLAFLVGEWRGSGRGEYPTIEPFAYDEEVVIAPTAKPVLRYEQRTRHASTGEPLHAEVGYVRLPEGRPELVIAQPTGIVEVHAGVVEGTSVEWRSTSIAVTPSAAAHRVLEVHRQLVVDGNEMRYEVHMAAAGEPRQVHLRAVLTRASA